ncbi:5659_t:CDS:1, partial [Funneliformis mosseae]
KSQEIVAHERNLSNPCGRSLKEAYRSHQMVVILGRSPIRLQEIPWEVLDPWKKINSLRGRGPWKNLIDPIK